MVAGVYLGKKETESLAKTKLALRPYTIVSSRERRQGSAINGPARIAGPPLTPLPSRQQIVIRETQHSSERTALCAQKELKPKERMQNHLDKAGIVRDVRLHHFLGRLAESQRLLA